MSYEFFDVYKNMFSKKQFVQIFVIEGCVKGQTFCRSHFSREWNKKEEGEQNCKTKIKKKTIMKICYILLKETMVTLRN